MSDVSDITTLVRYLIEDFSRTLIPGDIFTYGTSAVFTLSEPNIVSITNVFRNNTSLASSNYSFSTTTNQLTISSSLTVGDTIEVQYSYYSNYSDTEIENFIRSATVHLSINNYYTFEVDTSDNFYPDVTDKEKNLVAFITSILIKPDNRTIRLPDMTISVPNTLSTRDLISKAVRVFKQNSHGSFTII